MIYKDKHIWEENPSEADNYRQHYLDGCNTYIKRKNIEGKDAREKSAIGILSNEEREAYRKKYIQMLGIDLIEACDKAVEKIFVGRDDVCSIYRLTVYITEEIPFYAMLLVPHNAHNSPLIVAQHGGGGTPELCSDMNGTNNYNHMVQRVLERGAVVLAPQLMLWAKTETETMRAHEIEFDRAKIDNSFKRFGISITGLETKGIMKCIDYASLLPEVNSNNIGMIGCSYGGYYTLNTMAADTRIKAGYTIAAFNDKDVYDWLDWCYYKSALQFQDAELAALCAPRKLFISIGKKDEVFDYKTGLTEASRAERYYKNQGFEENFCFSLWDGGHTLPDDDKGIDFLFSAFN